MIEAGPRSPGPDYRGPKSPVSTGPTVIFVNNMSQFLSVSDYVYWQYQIFFAYCRFKHSYKFTIQSKCLTSDFSIHFDIYSYIFCLLYLLFTSYEDGSMSALQLLGACALLYGPQV